MKKQQIRKQNLFTKTGFAVMVSIICHTEVGGQDSQGFFLNDFQEKVAIIPTFENVQQTSSPATITINIDAKDTIAQVSKYVYGNNANIWMGKIITEANLMNYIRMLSPNVIRFPGGSISNLYFWNASNRQPPADAPAKLLDAKGNIINADYWFGRNTDNWKISLDNYYQMLHQTGNIGMITVNYGYARYGTGINPVQNAAHYAADLVRYDHGRTKFWELGNETYGDWEAGYRIDLTNNHDGQPLLVCGELYGHHYKIFADSMKKAAAETGSTIYLGAVLKELPPANYENDIVKKWNSGFFKSTKDSADFLIIHSYYTPYQSNSNASVILNSAIPVTAGMMNYLKLVARTNGVRLKPVALTEWNIFAQGSKQPCSFINGMHAAIVLGETIKNKFGGTNRYNLANGYSNGKDIGMFNIGDEPGVPKWNPRPDFFYTYYFQKFFGNHMISSSVSDTNVIAYASIFSSGQTGIVVINKGTSDQIVELVISHYKPGANYYYYSLTGGTGNEEFSQRVYVNDHAPDNKTGGPINDLANLKARAASIHGNVKISSPGLSVQYVLIEGISDVREKVKGNKKRVH